MRLIDADTLYGRLAFDFEMLRDGALEKLTSDDILEAIHEQPTIDPVKRGRWEARWNTLFKAYLPCCSVCSKSAVHTFDYCPNCGAKMDGESYEE